MTRPAEIGAVSALLAIATAGQAVFFSAAVLFRYGPDAWMPSPSRRACARK